MADDNEASGAAPASRLPPREYHLRTADDLDKLRGDYEAAGRQLTRWFWLVGGGLLLAALALALWGPRERVAVPTPTPGYVFRQAGTVQRYDTTWVWLLADTAGRARVLLSADQGHQWQVRDLGVDSSRAHALALGWGQPGRGLLVGDSGRVRRLIDVFRTPQAGRDTTVGNSPKESFFSVAVDRSGQQAVVLGRETAILKTTDQGKTWHQASTTKTGTVLDKMPELVTLAQQPHLERSFLLASTSYVYEWRPKDNEVELPDVVTIYPGSYWSTLLAAPLLYVGDDEDFYLLVETSGTAHLIPRSRTRYRYVGFLLFRSVRRPVALVPEWTSGLDSTLLFSNGPDGGQLRYLSLAHVAVTDDIRRLTGRQSAAGLVAGMSSNSPGKVSSTYPATPASVMKRVLDSLGLVQRQYEARILAMRKQNVTLQEVRDSLRLLQKLQDQQKAYTRRLQTRYDTLLKRKTSQ